MNLLRVRERFAFVVLVAMVATFLVASRACAQAGEPRDFAIRGAKVVPVSAPPMENATVLISRGIITAVGTNIVDSVRRLGHRR